MRQTHQVALRQNLPETSFRIDCVVKVATSLTRDSLGSGHSRSFWNSDLRNLSVIPHFEGTRDWGLTRASHGHFAQVTDLRLENQSFPPLINSGNGRCSLRTQLGLHPTYSAVLTACSLEQMFTSNIQLRCSTCRKLT